MRLGEFLQKECVDLVNGERLGRLSHADLSIDPVTGKIHSLILPSAGTLFQKRMQEQSFAWSSIKKIGPEMIIIHSSHKSR